MSTANNLQQFRLAMKLTKSELARRAGISRVTIDGIELGMPSHITTRRKILLALGLEISQRSKVFND